MPKVRRIFCQGLGYNLDLLYERNRRSLVALHRVPVFSTPPAMFHHFSVLLLIVTC